MSERQRCLICCADLVGTEQSTYHPRCLRELFGTTRMPTLDVDPSQLHLLGLEMAGRTTLSGVQRKIALGLEHQVLRVSASPSRFILKPAETRFPDLPENEHLCMRLARLVGLNVPPLGLVRIADGGLALIIRRFDRTESGGKLAMEDFCQLAEQLPADKYHGSAEQCVKLIRRYSAAPPLDLRELFRLFLFSWWIGNGDMHMKNLSLLSEEKHHPRLSPVYDLVNTTLVIPGDQLALPMGGKRDNLRTDDWLEFAERCALPPLVVTDLALNLVKVTKECLELTRRSFLPGESQVAFAKQLIERGQAIMELAERADEASEKRPKTAAPRTLTGEGVAKIRLELEQRLSELGLTFTTTGLDQGLADLDWLAGSNGSVFANDGRFSEDRERAVSALVATLNCDRFMRSLRRLDGVVGLNRVTKHLRELHLGTAQSDARAQQASDHLFQIELGALLETKFWSLEFERDEIDIVIGDSHSAPIGLECKRPRKSENIPESIREAIEQLRDRSIRGVVAISLDSLLDEYVSLPLGEHTQESWKLETDELIAAVANEVENLMPRVDDPNDDSEPQVLGVLFYRSAVLFQQVEEGGGCSAAVRSHVHCLANPALPGAPRRLEFLRDMTIAGERELWLSVGS